MNVNQRATPRPLASPLAIAPEFARLPAPIIIIGMHRSGTSLVAGMLSVLGVYVDPALPLPQKDALLDVPDETMRQSGYGEAVCFRLLNEAVMTQAGATWNHIAPFLAQCEQTRFRQNALERFRKATFGTLQQEFLAPLAPDFCGQWGWKDPRNSLTLPYWLALFPEARVVHVRRNPNDVATSLIRRAKATQNSPAAQPPSRAERLRNALRHPHLTVRSLGRRLGLSPPPATQPYSMLEREDCLRLAEEYHRACMSHCRHANHYLELWYEDIIETPEAHVEQLSDFLGLHPSEARFQHAVRFVAPRPELRTKPAETEPKPTRAADGLSLIVM